MRVLLIEDQADLADVLRRRLERAGFVIDHCATLDEAKAYVDAADYDAVILDRKLPDGDGIALLSWLRTKPSYPPVLVFSVLQDVHEKVRVLDAGAEDYLAKGATVEELAARLRVLGRRSRSHRPVPVRLGALEGDLATGELRVGGRPLILPRREQAILTHLLQNAGRVVPHAGLEAAVYSFDDEVGSNVMEANISRLRRRLTAAGAGIKIQAVRGLGYFVAEDADA